MVDGGTKSHKYKNALNNIKQINNIAKGHRNFILHADVKYTDCNFNIVRCPCNGPVGEASPKLHTHSTFT